MHIPTTALRGNAPSALVTCGAILLLAASAALGTYFGYQSGSHYHPVLGVIFAAAALGGEVLKPFAMNGAFEALKRWDLVRAPVCLAVALVCVVYSLASELALLATSRGDLAAERAAASQAAGDVKADRQRILNELIALKASRPLAEIDAVVAGARSKCRVILTLQGGRNTECSKPGDLLAEQGRAKRRAELDVALGRLDAQRGHAIVREADPLAGAVAYYIGAAGFAVKVEALSTWLYLVPVIFLEIGSAFGFVVAAAATTALPAATIAAPAAVASNRDTAPVTALVAGSTAIARLATVAKSMKGGIMPARQPTIGDAQLVIAALKAAGHALSNNELAVAMGVHKGEASKRRRKAEHLLVVERQGRRVVSTLRGQT